MTANWDLGNGMLCFRSILGYAIAMTGIVGFMIGVSKRYDRADGFINRADGSGIAVSGNDAVMASV